MTLSNTIYLPPSEKFRKLEARNTNYRFDLEQDVRWEEMEAPGVYFTDELVGGIDLSLFDAVEGLGETFNWAMAIGICEEFIALEEHVIGFFHEETEKGYLPVSRSVELFDEEEVKHIRLFRRFADALKARRPDIAQLFDKHLENSYEDVWWHGDHAGNYPSAAIHHFVNWLSAVFFEERTIHLYDVLRRGDDIQPA
uniref:Ferritin-like domain-containing protein n=1 Tax=Candidatus Kentrum sp. FW TaxID=2126338 RepID=A0A450TUW4_9GAMM|nr:MAG: hypothetical protein BECKFW1821C_GA0114237_103734 [Candidatus Kentron sp. FW]